MPFESLGEKLQMSLRRLTGRGRLTEHDIEEMMKEVRLSLLEADVNYRVVKSFVSDIKEQALGERILKSLTPGDQVVKIVHDELKKIMGEEAVPLNLKKNELSSIMLVGLQGGGKTTHCGKLALMLRKKEAKKPLLCGLDIYRPAAIDQLIQVGQSLGIDCFYDRSERDVVKIAKAALKFARENKNDVIIFDTAGRLHIDQELMDELVRLNDAVKPDEILLTIDSMMGQDSINVITSFNELLPITGCILTKLDGDTRGGAALSIRYLTNIPIKYVGVGEKLDQLEVFHPDRMADRILGMGDVVTLIEKATENIDENEAMQLMEKIQKGVFNYNDFLKMLKFMKRLGSLKGILGMIPGMGAQLKNVDVDDSQLNNVAVIISSMTPEERRKPELLAKSVSRRQRISVGSGRSYTEVNALTKRFEDMVKSMNQMTRMDPNSMHNPSMPTPKQKKGKGKGRGDFRIGR